MLWQPHRLTSLAATPCAIVSLVFLLSSAASALAQDVPSASERDGDAVVVPAPPADPEAASFRARLHDVQSRSELATALYLSSFVHLGGTLAGLIGAIPVGLQSSGGLFGMIGASIASFVGHIVTLSLAIHFDVTSGARRRALMSDFLRRRVVPGMEGASDDAALVEALF